MSKILHHVGRKEFKKTHQKKLDEQKNLAAKKLEEEKKIKQLEEVAKPLKSDWRKEINLQESDWTPIAGSGPTNSTAQTFSYSSPNFETGEPITYTASGLGGVEASNTGGQVFVDLGFGDGQFTNAPTYSQLALAGYAVKLNPKYAEAQKKYKKELAEWEKKRDENFQKVKDTLKSFGTSFEELRASKKWVKKLGDGTFVALMPTAADSGVMNWTDNVRVVKLKQAANADPMYIDYNTKQIDPVTGKKRPWMAYNVEIQNDVYLGVGERPKPPMEQEYLMPRRLDYKDVNPLLDLGQEYAERVGADYMMGARVKDAPDAPSFNYDPSKTPFGADYGEVSQVIDGEKLLPQRVQDILKKGRNKPARGGPDAINRELLDNYFKPEVQDVLQHRPELHDRYLRQMTGGAGGGYVPGGGMIDPSAPANAGAAALRNFSDFVRGLPQPGDAGYVNPNIIGRLARSATDNIRYAPGGQMITGLPSGVNYDPNFRSNMKLQRAVPGRNYGTPLQTMGRGELNVGRMYQDTNQLTRGTPFGNKSGTYNVQPTPTKGMRGVKNPFGSVVNRGWTGTPEIQIPKGGPQAARASADDLARAAAKSSTKTSRFLSRFIPGANAVLAGADVAQRSSQGDYFGAALGAASAFPGPAGWAALGGQIAYDALGRPFMGSPSTVTPTSGRGAGRSSFSTSDGNVVPRSSGMTDAQIKTAQDRANAARRAGKMSDIRGSQANRPYTFDKKTGEPQYTGWSDADYSEKMNQINQKWNEKTGPLGKFMYGKFGTGSGSASDAERADAYAKQAEYERARGEELDKLYSEYEKQRSEFEKAQNDWMAQETAASEARAKAVDKIDNEKDPFSDLLSKLGYEREKLQRQGKAIKRWELVGPGEEGYVDTTNMANAIGYNRRPIYTAAANELDKQIDAAQKSQMAWMNARDKRRQAAIDADYKPKRGQGGLPLGTTTNRSGGAMGSRSQATSLASQAASAGMNPQQRRKRGMKESTWDRINKYR